MSGFATLACSIGHSLLLGTAPPAELEPPPELEPPIQVKVRGQRSYDHTAPSTVIPRAELREEPVQDLPSVLDEQPSLRVSRLGGLGSYATLSVRGSSAEQVLVTLDGIPLNAADGGPVDLSLLPLGPLERVEIYRGMAPLDLGNSAIGGAVGLVTRSPRGPVVELEAGGGSFGSRLLRLFAGLGQGRTSVALSVDYLGSEGDFTFSSDGGTRLGATHTDDDGERVRTNADFDQVSTLLRAAVPVGNVLVRVTDLLSFREQGLPGIGLYTTEAARLETLRNLLGLSIEARSLGALDGAITVTPYTSVTRVRLSDPLGELGLASPTATRDQLWSAGARAVGSLSFDVGGVGELDGEPAVLLRPKIIGEYRFESFAPEDTISRGEPSDRHLGVVGGELSAELPALGLELVVGGRAELIASHVVARTIAPGEARVDRDADTVGASWRACAVWTPLERLSVRASASQSLRPPSLFELFGNTGAVIGNPSLVPEHATTGDLGLVASGLTFGDLTLSAELYGYVTRAKDLIVLVSNGQDVAQAQNVASAWLYGAELGLRLDAPHLAARLSGAWLETENTADIAAQHGRALPHRPRWKGLVRLEGFGELGTSGVELRGAAELEAVGMNFVDAANLSALDTRLWLGFTLSATYRSVLTASIRVDNALDVASEDLVGYPLPGVQVMASVRYTPLAEAPR